MAAYKQRWNAETDGGHSRYAFHNTVVYQAEVLPCKLVGLMLAGMSSVDRIPEPEQAEHPAAQTDTAKTRPVTAGRGDWFPSERPNLVIDHCSDTEMEHALWQRIKLSGP